MCGLFGWIGKDHQLAKAGMIAAALMDARGGDSWGVYDGTHIEKGLGKIGPSLSGAMRSWNYCLGHTRYGTTGKATIDNAHPFQVEDLIGAHNGMVYNHMELNRDYGRRCDVDSMHIFLHLHEQRPLQEIEAYGTITYALQGEQAVRLGRFNGGELALGRTKAGWIWASTESALKIACMIADLHIDGIFSLKQGREYVLTPDRLKRRGRLAFSQISNWHAGSGGFDWAQWEDEATMQGTITKYKGALTQPAYQAPTKRYTALAGPK